MTSIMEWLLGLKAGTLAGGDWRIAFTGETSNYLRLALLCVLGGMVWLTVRCYRRDGQAHRRLRGVLAGVRIAVILVLLAILLQPAVVLRIQRTLYSTVLVLFDDSLSMAQKDRWQGTDEATTREALEEALGGENPADESRSDIARKILLAPGGPVEAMRKDHPVEVLAFSTDRPGKESYTRSLASLPRLGGGRDADEPARRRVADGRRLRDEPVGRPARRARAVPGPADCGRRGRQ